MTTGYLPHLMARAFDVYAAKAQVALPGPRRTAERMRRVFEYLLHPGERRELGTALSHALDVGEGRQEFDEVCARIRRRLFGDAPTV